MPEPDVTLQPAPHRSRWIWGVIVLVISIASSACYIEPVVRERQAIAKLEKRGIDIRMQPRHPKWLWEHFGDAQRTAVELSNRTHPPFFSFPPSTELSPGSDFALYESFDVNGESRNSPYSTHSFVCEVSKRDLRNIGRLRNLKSLSLTYVNLTADDVRRFAGLANLKHLALMSEQDLSPKLLQPIQRLTGLQSLYLAHVIIDNETVELLACFPELKQLCLSAPEINETGWAPVLQELDLYELQLLHTKLNAVDLAAIAKLENLSELILDDTDIDDTGLRTLTALKNLESLSVLNTNVNAEGVADFEDAVPHCQVNFGEDRARETIETVHE